MFGARLARLLDSDAQFELFIAGRDAKKAERVAADLGGPARKHGVSFEISEIRSALQRYNPEFVVHCAGPFQGQDYGVASACIAAAIPYADMSDGRAFSQGFEALDKAAKKADVFALTAASTTSALSSAVALYLSDRLDRVHCIRVGVTPGNRAPRGRAVVKAILGYVGEPIPVRRKGKQTSTTGWGDLQRIEISGLGRRWFSACDAPDQIVMPKLFPESRDVEFLAGLELSVLHLPLWVLARMRRWRMIPVLSRASGFFHQIASWFEPFGADAGGMFVEIEGAAGDRPLSLRWSLVAQSGDGPSIPAMATAALARRVAAGAPPPPGARICAGDVTLAEFEREFAAFDIKTAIEESE